MKNLATAFLVYNLLFPSIIVVEQVLSPSTLNALQGESSSENIYDIQTLDIDQKPLNFSEFRNKVILIFNFSSKCATASQLSEFENLKKRFAHKDLVIVAAPSSDFAPMNLDNSDELKDFCKNKYQISFQILAEVNVKGPKVHPLFEFLTRNKNPDYAGEVAFNMEKFLIGKDGTVLKRYNPFAGATSRRLIHDIEVALKQESN